MKDKKDEVNCFYVEDAKKYGINQAVILYNIRFWLKKNKANKKNIFDKRVWTYNSTTAFVELFPFLSESQIKTILKNLINDGIIIKGNFNKVKYDRTSWYSINEDEFAEKRLKTSLAKNDLCISENDVKTKKRLKTSLAKIDQSNSEISPIEQTDFANRTDRNRRPIPDVIQIVNTDLAKSPILGSFRPSDERAEPASEKNLSGSSQEGEKDKDRENEKILNIAIVETMELFKEIFPVEFAPNSFGLPFSKPANRNAIEAVLNVYTKEQIAEIIAGYKKYHTRKFYAGVSQNIFEFCGKIEKIKNSNLRARDEEPYIKISQFIKLGNNSVETKMTMGQLTHDMPTPLLDAITTDVMNIPTFNKRGHDFQTVRRLVYGLGSSHAMLLRRHYKEDFEKLSLYEIFWKEINRMFDLYAESPTGYRDGLLEMSLEVWDKNINTI